jgi:hypothetical protein
MKQTGLGHGSAGTDKEAAEEGGIAPLLQYVTAADEPDHPEALRPPDLEFSWVEDREVDPKVAADIDDIAQERHALRNEVRDRNGEAPIEGGDEPMVYLPTGPVPVSGYRAGGRRRRGCAPEAARGARSGTEPPDPTARRSRRKEPARRREATKRCRRRTSRPRSASPRRSNPTSPTRPTRSRTRSSRPRQGRDGRPERQDRIRARRRRLELGRPAGDPRAADRRHRGRGRHRRFVGAQPVRRRDAQAHDGAGDRIRQRARRRAGRHEVVDGELVENPDAAWSIAETTRTMLRSAVTDAMERARRTTSWRPRSATPAPSARRAPRRSPAPRPRRRRPGHDRRLARERGGRGPQWVSSPDCCDECQTYDGTIIGIDEEFDWGDEPLTRTAGAPRSAVLPRTCPTRATKPTTPTLPTDIIFARCGASSQGTKPMFIPLLKVDAAQRLVYGSFDETPDRAREICDYATAKPPSRNGRRHAQGQRRQELRQHPRPA